MKNLTIKTLVVILGLTVTSSVYAEGDPEKGRELFKICSACHGQNGEGNKDLNAPANGGQNEWYVIRQLKNFRAGIRGADPKDTFGIQMRPMAMSLPDDQAVEDVAAYVATLVAPSPPKTVTGDAEAGKKAFVPCVACHGEKGEGSKSLNAPRLSRQHDWYIVRQLQNFKAGIRGAHPKDIYGTQMRPMAQLLATDEQVNDVAAYISTLE
ncbi:MAG: c-type cytochrome [Gammaproteobacteria bacterium]|nr:c-type cytochrome [Gammaproteobacteria bacterium]